MPEFAHRSDGFLHASGYFDRMSQEALLAEVQTVVSAAPFYRPTMPKSGRPMSVKMTNAGTLGWVTDQALGYRYQKFHPNTGEAWPVIPKTLLTLWDAVSGCSAPPEACLVNWYHCNASKMGLHVDKDEEAKDAAVVSVSLGASAWFRLGGPERRDKTMRMRLDSGDVIVLGDASRRYFHGLDRVIPNSSTLLPSPQRINLTLRRVNPI